MTSRRPGRSMASSMSVWGLFVHPTTNTPVILNQTRSKGMVFDRESLSERRARLKREKVSDAELGGGGDRERKRDSGYNSARWLFRYVKRWKMVGNWTG